MAKKSVAEIMGRQNVIQKPEYKVSAKNKVDTFVKTSAQDMPNDRNKQIADAINQAVGVAGDISQEHHAQRKQIALANADATFSALKAERKKNGGAIYDSDTFKQQPLELQMQFMRERGAEQWAEAQREIEKELIDNPSIQGSEASLKALYDKHGGQRALTSTNTFDLTRDSYFNNLAEQSYEKSLDAGIVYRGKEDDAKGAEAIRKYADPFIKGTLLSLDGKTSITTLDQLGEENWYIRRLLNQQDGANVVKGMLAESAIAEAVTFDESPDLDANGEPTGTFNALETNIDAGIIKLNSFPKAFRNEVIDLKILEARNKLIAQKESVKEKAYQRQKTLDAAAVETATNWFMENPNDPMPADEYAKLRPAGKAALKGFQDNNLAFQLSEDQSNINMIGHLEGLKGAMIKGGAYTSGSVTGLQSTDREAIKEWIRTRTDLLPAQKASLLADAMRLRDATQFLETSQISQGRAAIKPLTSWVDNVDVKDPNDTFDADEYRYNIQNSYEERVLEEIVELGRQPTGSELRKISQAILKDLKDQADIDHEEFKEKTKTSEKMNITGNITNQSQAAADKAAIAAADAALDGQPSTVEVDPQAIQESIQDFTNQFTPFDQ